MSDDISALLAGASHDPFAVLGWHRGPGPRWTARVFMPGAAAVALLPAGDGPARPLSAGGGGLFHGEFPDRFEYRISAAWPDGAVFECGDAYLYPEPFFSEYDLFLFGEGSFYEIHRAMGALPRTVRSVRGFQFSVWAPNAVRVSVAGDFNAWDGRRHQMRSLGPSGVWSLFIPGIDDGVRYKYEIRCRDGSIRLKSDPCGSRFELRPATASVTWTRPPAAPDAWRDARSRADHLAEPMAVYEMHLGSWLRPPGGGFPGYRETGERLAAYLSETGFNWVEFLPLTEYPLDESWGYQTTGFYAPTGRHGSPDDFRALVDILHRAGIGVILDWTPAHFPKDDFALYRFDGTHLYEHADPRLRDHPDWRSAIFNYGRREVANFLTGSALSMLDGFGVDGLRVDAVASMLYLDYSRREGEWLPNRRGGRENLDAVDFIRRFNAAVYGRSPGRFTVAEESTAWPAVSRPVHTGGLGFGFKWNMGWMHDTLSYFSTDPVFRKYRHGSLTFSLLYAFSENFFLPLSHDEVVHGKGSIIGRMPGDWWRRRANLRLLLTYLYTHPGKKLLFMGTEFGQENEWNWRSSLDWHLLEREEHRGIRRLAADLNAAYRGRKALHELDHDPAGFRWIDFSDVDQSVVAFERVDRAGNAAVVVLNFTPVPRFGYRVGVSTGEPLRELVNSDSRHYGGSDMGNAGVVTPAAAPCHGRPFSVSLTLPPLAGLILAPAR